MIDLSSLLNSRPDICKAYAAAFAVDRAGADSLVSRYQDMWDSGDSFLADGMDAFTFPQRDSDSAEELNACLSALAHDLKWFAVKSRIKSLSSADVDSLYNALLALGGAHLNICGCELIPADVKSIYHS